MGDLYQSYFANKNLTAVQKAAARVIVTNEVSDSSSIAFKLTKPVSANSGFSFGPVQFDLGSGGSKGIFREALTKGGVSEQDADKFSNLLSGKKGDQSNLLKADDVAKIDAALNSAAARDFLVDESVKKITGGLDKVDSVIAGASAEVKAAFENNDVLRLALVDYDNKFNLSATGKMVDFLKGNEVTIGSGANATKHTFNPNDPAVSLLKFVTSTDEAYKVERSFNGLSDILKRWERIGDIATQAGISGADSFLVVKTSSLDSSTLPSNVVELIVPLASTQLGGLDSSDPGYQEALAQALQNAARREALMGKAREALATLSGEQVRYATDADGNVIMATESGGIAILGSDGTWQSIQSQADGSFLLNNVTPEGGSIRVQGADAVSVDQGAVGLEFGGRLVDANLVDGHLTFSSIANLPEVQLLGGDVVGFNTGSQELTMDVSRVIGESNFSAEFDLLSGAVMARVLPSDEYLGDSSDFPFAMFEFQGISDLILPVITGTENPYGGFTFTDGQGVQWELTSHPAGDLEWSLTNTSTGATITLPSDARLDFEEPSVPQLFERMRVGAGAILEQEIDFTDGFDLGGINVVLDVSPQEASEPETQATLGSNHQVIGQVITASLGVIGSQLGQLLAGDNLALGLVTGQIGSSLLESLGQTMQGIEVTVDGVATEIAGGLVTSIGNQLGSRLGASLAEKLGINAQAGSLVGSVVGGTVAGQIGAVIARDVFGATSGFGLTTFKPELKLLPDGSVVETTPAFTDIPSFANSLAYAGVGAIASFAGNALANALFDLNPQGSSIGSAIGGAIGGAIAGIGSLWTFGLSVFAGSFLGSILGGLFGGSSVGPNTNAWVNFNAAADLFVLGAAGADNGADINISINMAKAARDLLNNVADSIGGDIISAGGDRDYGFFGGAFRTNELSGFSSAGDAIQAGAFAQLKPMQVAGGDLYMKRALANSAAGSLTGLLDDIQTAQTWGLYRDNEALFERIMQDTIDAGGAAGIEAQAQWDELQVRAAALNLDAAAASDTYVAEAGKKLVAADVVAGNIGIVAGTTGADDLQSTATGHMLQGGAGNDIYRFGRGSGRISALDEVRGAVTMGSAATLVSVIHHAEQWIPDGSEGPGIQIPAWDETVYSNVSLARSGAVGLLDGGQDALQFGEGVAADDIILRRDGNDLLVGLRDANAPDQTFAELADSIRLIGWYDSQHRIETFKLFDGTTLALDGTIPHMNAQAAVELAEDLVANSSDDEQLRGGAGDDIYTFGHGSGRDTLLDRHETLQAVTEQNTLTYTWTETERVAVGYLNHGDWGETIYEDRIVTRSNSATETLTYNRTVQQ
ncbi:MAG: hypothetical protein VW600_01420, partial [Ferrovibrio sp.]